MTKDTRGLDKNEVVKKDIAAKQSASDAAIAAQAKDMTPEQVLKANEERGVGITPVQLGPITKQQAIDASPAVADPNTPKPTIEEITPGQEAKAAARNVGTARPERTTVLDFGKLPSRPEGGATAASVNVTDKPDVAINLIDRLKSGMGLPGEEQGHLDLALKLHESDREVAARTGKVVNDVQPNDPKATHLTVFGGHHHRLAKVMNTFKISDPEIYKNAASATGQRLATLVHGLHKIAQEHEDSKRTITHTPKEGAMWEHPETKEIIPVAANHPDMPSAFTRTKGKVARVSRDASGAVVTTRSHEGWDSMKVRGGTTVYRKYGAPKGIDLVDHMRAEMLSEHGVSATSRAAHANRTTDILEQMNSSIPRDKKQIGVQKVAKRTTPTITSRPKAQRTKSPGASKIYRLSPTNVETTEPLLVDKAKPGKAAGTKPNPPKARTGKMLVGTAPLDQPLGPKAKPAVNTAPPKKRPVQDYLPGTGVPQRQTEVVTPAQYKRAEGPLEGWARRAVDETSNMKNPIKEADVAPRIKTADEVTRTTIVPTDRDWKPESTAGRGQQFKVDVTSNQAGPGQKPLVDTTFTPTETTTGLEDLKAIKAAGGLSYQQPSASREIVVRPGGKKQAKRDARAAKATPKPSEPEQLSLFPDHEVVPGRSNQFYMAGSVQPISDKSKVLQGSAKARFGRQPNNKDFETENEGSILNRLQAGSKKKD